MNQVTEDSSYENELSQIQELTFIQEKKELAIRNIPLGENHFELLRMVNEEEEYTNLALLLSDQCPHKISMTILGGAIGSAVIEKKETTGSLFKQMRDCFSFIEKHNKSHRHKKGLFVVQEKGYPEVAIRESLINALIHRDYNFTIDTSLNIYEDHMEIINIGGLIDGITIKDIKMGISMARNKNLTKIFYRLSLVDSHGIGIPNIYRVYSSNKKQPVLQATDNVFKIILP